MTMLPDDYARCRGDGDDSDWREGCEDCLRRTTPCEADRLYTWVTPPPIIVFWCELRIPPEARDERAKRKSDGRG
jgi:hypothetical protein